MLANKENNEKIHKICRIYNCLKISKVQNKNCGNQKCIDCDYRFSSFYELKYK